MSASSSVWSFPRLLFAYSSCLLLTLNYFHPAKFPSFSFVALFLVYTWTLLDRVKLNAFLLLVLQLEGACKSAICNYVTNPTLKFCSHMMNWRWVRIYSESGKLKKKSFISFDQQQQPSQVSGQVGILVIVWVYVISIHLKQRSSTRTRESDGRRNERWLLGDLYG